MTSGKKSSADALSTLKHCCKMNMYNMRMSGQRTAIEGLKNTYVRVQAEEIKPGERDFVHRVMLMGENQAYSGVGWVVDGDCDSCMSCHIRFGMTVWRHHCRMCGNTICNSCSLHRVDLKDECDLEESGASRVCNQCHVDLHFRMARLYDGEPEKVEAINPLLQEAPTPAGKSRKQPTSGMMSVNSKSGLMNPKSILKTTLATSNEVDIKGKDQSVSPVTAMLNNLDGRWDRSDDGISTPGSLPVSADSRRGTPDENSSEMSGARTVSNSAKSTTTDKYFFTPNSAFGDHGAVGTGRASSTGRKVLGDVTQERLTPKVGKGALPSSSSSSSRVASTKGGTGRRDSRKKKKVVVVREDRENVDGNYSPLPDTPSTAASSPKKSPSSSRFVPVPSFVIKGTIDNYMGVLGATKTVYVNVCKHGSVPVPTSKQLKSSEIAVSYVVGDVNELDRQGETVLCVDVCYHNQVHVWAYADENGINLSALAEHAVVCVNSRHSLNMWISSLPQYTTYHGNVKPLVMRVLNGYPETSSVSA